MKPILINQASFSSPWKDSRTPLERELEDVRFRMAKARSSGKAMAYRDLSKRYERLSRTKGEQDRNGKRINEPR